MSRPMMTPVFMIEFGFLASSIISWKRSCEHDGQPVDIRYAGALAVGQAQAAADGLLDQRF